MRRLLILSVSDVYSFGEYVTTLRTFVFFNRSIFLFLEIMINFM